MEDSNEKMGNPFAKEINENCCNSWMRRGEKKPKQTEREKVVSRR